MGKVLKLQDGKSSKTILPKQYGNEENDNFFSRLLEKLSNGDSSMADSYVKELTKNERIGDPTATDNTLDKVNNNVNNATTGINILSSVFTPGSTPNFTPNLSVPKSINKKEANTNTVFSNTTPKVVIPSPTIPEDPKSGNKVSDWTKDPNNMGYATNLISSLVRAKSTFNVKPVKAGLTPVPVVEGTPLAVRENMKNSANKNIRAAVEKGITNSESGNRTLRINAIEKGNEAVAAIGAQDAQATQQSKQAALQVKTQNAQASATAYNQNIQTENQAGAQSAASKVQSDAARMTNVNNAIQSRNKFKADEAAIANDNAKTYYTGLIKDLDNQISTGDYVGKDTTALKQRREALYAEMRTKLKFKKGGKLTVDSQLRKATTEYLKLMSKASNEAFIANSRVILSTVNRIKSRR